MAEVGNALDLKQPENGKAPDMRIDSADKAAQIVALLVDANQSRAAAEATTKATLDGHPPFDQNKLRAANQGNRTNVNFREAEGIHDAALTPYYDLFAEAPCYCEVTLDVKESDRALKSRIVTEEFDYLLRSWDGFDHAMQMTCSNMVDYGKGFVMWPDDENWQPEWIKQSKILVPDQSPASLDQLELMVIRESWPLTKLWKKVKDKDTATRVGWNAGAVAGAMSAAVPDDQMTGGQTDHYEYWLNRMRNNDLYESISNKSVKAAHVLVKEFNGKVSHLIVEETGLADKSVAPSTVPVKKFLYKKKGRFDSFRQVVGALFYDLGDGTWHSIKGLLIKMHAIIEIKTRANCVLVDNMFMNMSCMVTTQNTKDIESLALLEIGPLRVLPPGTTPVQWQLSGAMQDGLAVDNHLNNKLQANLGTYRQVQRREQGNPDTATKVQFDAAKEAMLSKGAVNRWYSQMDFIGEEMYRRASNPKLPDDTETNKMARKFQKRCKDRGVSVEDLKKIRQVRWYRNIGNGSIFARKQAIMDSMFIVPMLNESGRENWKDDAIAAIGSYELANRWNPKGDFDPKIQADERMAALQISAAKTGVAPVMTDVDNHVVYADKYLKAAADSFTALEQGGDPMQTLAFLDIIMPATAERLNAIRSDSTRKPAYDALMQRWKQLAQMTDQLRGQVKQMQQQQAAQAQKEQQVMTDEQLKEAESQSAIRRKDTTAANNMRLKNQASQQKLAIADTKTAQEFQINRMKAAQSNGNGNE